MTQRLTVHLPDDIAAVVRASGQTISGRLVTIISRYQLIVSECRPRLAYADWLHICEASNRIEAMREHPETARRFAALTLAERIAVVDVAEQFWADQDHDIAAALALLGIVSEAES